MHDALYRRQLAATVLDHEIPQGQADFQSKQNRHHDRPHSLEGNMCNAQEQHTVKTRAHSVNRQLQTRAVALGQGDGQLMVVERIERPEKTLKQQQGDGPVQKR
ncbi:hypothetical protein D3C78_748540 [compost metagenome]